MFIKIKASVGVIACGLVMLASTSFAKTKTITISFEEDDQSGVAEEEIAPMLIAPVVVVQPVEEPENLEPPKEEASEPRRLVRYFCRLWKDESYEKMYWAMTQKYRKEVSLEHFKNLFEEEAEINGGLADENIVGDDLNKGKKYELAIELRYNNITARDRKAKVVLEKTKDGYRICESGIIPLDLNNL